MKSLITLQQREKLLFQINTYNETVPFIINSLPRRKPNLGFISSLNFVDICNNKRFLFTIKQWMLDIKMLDIKNYFKQLYSNLFYNKTMYKTNVKIKQSNIFTCMIFTFHERSEHSLPP